MFLTWDPPESADQNGIIQMYTIDMTVAETGENLQLTSEHTEFHLDKLHPYYTYSFVISAVTTGRGPPSTVYNVTTEEEGKNCCYHYLILAGLAICSSTNKNFGAGSDWFNSSPSITLTACISISVWPLFSCLQFLVDLLRT